MTSKQHVLSTGNTIRWKQAAPIFENGDLSADCHPAIRQAVAYWRSIHPDHGLPGRQHLDPIDIPGLLAHIRLVDVVGEPPRFRVRLSGSHVESHLGIARPGEWFDALFEDFETTPTYDAFITAVQTRRPNWRTGVCELKCGDLYTPVERVQLPFARDGETVDMIMVCVVFGEPDNGIG